MKKYILLIVGIISLIQLKAQNSKPYDICVYGGTAAGVIAAYTAKQSGKTVLLIEPGKHVGGLTTGGLGFTDIGNKYAITGLARDFYRRVGEHYGKFEQWIFEPHVAENILMDCLKRASVQPLLQHRVVRVEKKNGFIKNITIESSSNPGTNAYQTITAKVFIDCSYEGDLMAKAGVSYFTGREANSLYNETYNGVQLRDKHQFPDGIDPYKIPGKPESGLLWGISNEPLQPQGSGDKKIQAYNFRICLTSDPANKTDITKPADYDPSRYELLLRYLEKKPAKDLGGFLKFDLMPNNKTDINNNGPFSTDMIGMNYNYPEADYKTRSEIQAKHEAYTKGLLYFIGHDLRMPQHLRERMLRWGYPKDEYTDNHNWSPQMYVREVRRMKGDYVMTQANCEGKEVVEDGIGMAAYTMDSHNCERIVVNGMVKNEGDVQIGGFGPYPVSYRSLIPKPSECKNLLVPVCLSATHIAYGSIRMEPVFMVLAQSAAMAAVMAVDSNKAVQDINIKKLQQELIMNPLADNSTPEILVDNDDAVQAIVKGNWQKETRGSYGPSMYVTNGAAGETASVTFMPAVKKAGSYKIYTYMPKFASLSPLITAEVYDGKTIIKKEIKESDINVQGQTSGEWVELGSYSLPAGKKAYVKISNKGSQTIVADAVLFVPEFKNINF
ncbi:FAD-dependent oxidoreductase [Parafilimonas terrae]|uniref:FAD dependent oxidoreductase n=1 Tax=Parafilimonas terrae TaxID=1465490 RepID=A0A1I5X9I3_9BACT|nr:FAD-dependent oxidoreductase [Parafilimonas terrae]SFQ28564.1 FAD dependent oxidoreductase [Parafilimonas terrae]